MGLGTVKDWDDVLGKLKDPSLWESEEARAAVLAGVEAATKDAVDDAERLEKGRKFLGQLERGLRLIPGLLT